jgi:hypothetical protein
MDKQRVTIQNALKISRGNETHYLHSSHRHDYIAFDFPDGTNVFLDGGDIFNGGGFYTRSNIFINKEFGTQRGEYVVRDWALDESSTWHQICERLLWGHRGKDGKQPLTKAPLNTFEKSHLENILKNEPNISALHKAVITYLLETEVFK